MHIGRQARLLVVIWLWVGVAACGGADEKRSGAETSRGGIATVPGFDGATIRLGVLTPLSGPVAAVGNPLTAGNEVYFRAVNAKGGIAGRYEVELVQEDTHYQTDTTVQKYNKLKDEVVAFTQILGTAPTLAVLPQLARDKMIAAPAAGDAFWIREPNLLPIGAPYQIQAVNGLDYFVNNGGEGKTICSMIQDDAYGEAGQEGVDFAADRLGFDVATTQRFKVGEKDMVGQVQRLSRTRCAAVLLAATPSDAGTIWGTAAKLGFAPRWIALSPSWIGQLASSPLKDYLAETTWITADGTEWGDGSVPAMKQMLADIEAHKPDQAPDYYFVFGYNQAHAVAALLEKAVELGDLSREGLLVASEQLGTVSFGGLTDDYTYGPASRRDPPRAITIFEVDPAKPFGLGRLEYQYKSQAAEQLEFRKEDL